MSLSIQDALNKACETLAAPKTNAALEAAVLLANVLGIPRVQLHSRPEQLLRESQLRDYFNMIGRRAAGEPVAYLIGHREFWSLDLIVNKHTLIPRPETELVVELALTHIPPHGQFDILDLGTGSGAIALAIATERPQCRITATDLSSKALDVARTNAERLEISNIAFHEGAWFAPFATERFDIIVSNPPYVAENDPYLLKGDLPAEPRIALVAGQSGMEMLTAIAEQTPHYLKAGGWLLMEHAYNQAATVAAMLSEMGYHYVYTRRDLAGEDRVTSGQYG